MPDFGETPELAESGSHSQNPGIGRIDPPPRGRGSDPGIGVFLGEAPETQEIEEFGGIRGTPLEMADPGGSDPPNWPKPGGQTPKNGPNRPQKPRKDPISAQTDPKTSNSGVSDPRFRPKGGIPPKTQKSAHFLLSSPLKRPHFQEFGLSSTKPPCFWHHPPVPGVAGN